jgi:hypothetical protein
VNERHWEEGIAIPRRNIKVAASGVGKAAIFDKKLKKTLNEAIQGL